MTEDEYLGIASKEELERIIEKNKEYIENINLFQSKFRTETEVEFYKAQTYKILKQTEKINKLLENDRGV